MTTKTEEVKKDQVSKPKAAPTRPKKEEVETLCYIGPNLPDGTLKKNSIIVGTKTEVKEQYKEEIEKYPQLERLMVKIENLADAKAKVEREGNILNKYYNDINSTIIANKEAAER